MGESARPTNHRPPAREKYRGRAEFIKPKRTTSPRIQHRSWTLSDFISRARALFWDRLFFGYGRDAQKTQGRDRWKALIQGRRKLASLITGDRWHPPGHRNACADAAILR